MPVYRFINAGAALAEALDNLQDLRDRFTVSAGVVMAASPFGNCVELDGVATNINLGDVQELNAVSAFTIAFWMNQDALDVGGIVFFKQLDADNRVYALTQNSGLFDFVIENSTDASGYGSFDYSTLIGAGEWHHVAMVFDGTQTGNADRLKVYVDGNPVVLVFTGTIPAVTSDMASNDLLIGYTSVVFDGKLRDFLLFPRALVPDEILDLATHKAF